LWVKIRDNVNGGFEKNIGGIQMIRNNLVFRGIFVAAIAFIVFLPLFLTGMNKGFKNFGWQTTEQVLSGQVNEPKIPVLSVSNVLSGTFQTDFEQYFAYKLTGRLLLTRLYNSILYLGFHSSDSTQYVVGRDDYIYDRIFASNWFYEPSNDEKRLMESKVSELNELKTLLSERGIGFGILIAPSKERILPEFMPSEYDRYVEMKTRGDYSPDYAMVFEEYLQKNVIDYVDPQLIFSSLKESGKTVFTKGGIHWTLQSMAVYINSVQSMLSVASGASLGQLQITSEEERIGVPYSAYNNYDADINDIIWNTPLAKKDFLSPYLSFNTINGEFMPNLFICGDSFMWLPLSTIYGLGVTNTFNVPLWGNTDFSYYNREVYSFPGPQITSGETSNFEQVLSKDFVLLEFTQTNIDPNSPNFVFAENLLNYLKEVR
jgi:hypothetical protein